MQVSYFNGMIGATPHASLSLFKILNGIKNGFYERGVLHLRSQDGSSRDLIKKTLPAFTQSGTFFPTRAKKNVVLYNGIVPVDIDKVDNPGEIRDLFQKLNCTISSFITCSGRGVCALIQTTNVAPEKHSECCKQVWAYIETELPVSVQIDTSSSDVSRLRIISHDPDLYLNTTAEPFSFVPTSSPAKKEKKITGSRYELSDILPAILRKAEQNPRSNNGRNERVYTIACEAKKAGIPEKSILNYCCKLAEEDFTIPEITRAIKSAYDNKEIPFAVYVFKNGHFDREVSCEGTRIAALIAQHINIRYDVVKYKLEYLVKDRWEYCGERELNTVLLSIPQSEKVNHNHFWTCIKSNHLPVVNMVQEYFALLPGWDGKDYIKEFFSIINTPDPRASEWFKKFYVGAFAQFFRMSKMTRPGDETREDTAENQMMLILQGSQGCGKSTFLKNLLPSTLSSYLTEKDFDPTNKDDVIMLAKYVFFIWDELSSWSKKEAAIIKKAVSQGDSDIRAAYERDSARYFRRASLCGSTNETTFLVDKTGNRRFIIIPIIGLIDNTKIKQSLYPLMLSQVKALLDSDYRYWFDYEENQEMSAANEDYMEQDPLDSTILKLFEIVENGMMLFADVIKIINNFNPSLRVSPKKVGESLLLMGIGNRMKRVNGKVCKTYKCKERALYDQIEIEDLVEKQKILPAGDFCKSPDEDLPF